MTEHKELREIISKIGCEICGQRIDGEALLEEFTIDQAITAITKLYVKKDEVKQLMKDMVGEVDIFYPGKVIPIKNIKNSEPEITSYKNGAESFKTQMLAKIEEGCK